MTSPSIRIPLGLALAALSAAMLVLAFPPHNLWPLIWFAFARLLLAQYRLLNARGRVQRRDSPGVGWQRVA